MVKINKSDLPDGVKITRDKDLDGTGPVWETLLNDCNEKCYICENNDLTDIEIEHIVPWRGDNAKKFDWNNLLLACSNCNKIKGERNILNPVKDNPELHIALELDFADSSFYILVSRLDSNKETNRTEKLLNSIYNGDNTADRNRKNVHATNLRKKISKELAKFYVEIAKYKNAPDLHVRVISDAIKTSSVFAAFKRKMVRDDAELYKDFAKEIDE